MANRTAITDPPAVSGEYVQLDGETCYRIANCQRMKPFFMSLVGASDHWMFVASNGALTAGRQDASNALFPYYASDKLVDLVESCGPRTIIRMASDGETRYWLPFLIQDSTSDRTVNLYKNVSGTKLHFEELNSDLDLLFRYSWEFSERFGFVRTSHLANMGTGDQQIEIVDGLQNILPYGMDEMFQLRFSNLGNAYKKNELLEESQLGIFYLSSIPSDRAEPSEGLRSTVVWQTGLERPQILLSDQQLAAFKQGDAVTTETDVRGRRGCYFVNTQFDLGAGESRRWTMVANLKQDQADVANLADQIMGSPDLITMVREDVAAGQAKLRQYVAAADGIQRGGCPLRTQRHMANVIFNLMRGGTPFHGYDVSADDFFAHVRSRNRSVFGRHTSLVESVGVGRIPFQQLMDRVDQTGDQDLIRITQEYLPLTFGRRHGDPTRPWNKFSIDLKNEDGSERLDYQGNWRDIFQNWEALGHSYPLFLNGMVLRFLNASTADGYNPYRVTKSGFDWEKPDPEDPWANIGYWGDHQIIYLAKLLEWSKRFFPQRFGELLFQDLGVYANVPYRICDYRAMRSDADNTITYDFKGEQEIVDHVAAVGYDGQLVFNQSDQIQRVCVLEKLLLPALVKISNLVPGAGIWLNTQRPEWNDANNALVGSGTSVVTVCYLRRFFCQLIQTLESVESTTCQISVEILDYYNRIETILQDHQPRLEAPFDDRSRCAIVDQLQLAASDYRQQLYDSGLSGKTDGVAVARLAEFAQLCVRFLDQTILENQRDDGLYHTYNLIEFDGDQLKVEYLYEMLEGQVAVLSSQLLSGERSVKVLDALRNSSVYRDDLHTYMLYPDQELPRFMEKNRIDADRADQSRLIQALIESNDQRIIRRDARGGLHFNGDFRNAEDLRTTLKAIADSNPNWQSMVEEETGFILDLFEHTFQHHRFTGRSGTFFAYEGLGSVYWHMVSKLALAVTEIYERAVEENAGPELLAQLRSHYREIRDGLGLGSSPEQYGAFPTDPYSHTPAHAGAQQPGMTGQVKEDILARFSELGVRIRGGRLGFEPSLFESLELLETNSELEFFDVQNRAKRLAILENRFAFTVCQVPVVYVVGDQPEIRIFRADADGPDVFAGNQLTESDSRSVFLRDGTIERIEVVFNPVEN